MTREVSPRLVGSERTTGDIPYLNGLRGIAALWVLVAHCMIWGGWTRTQIPDPVIAVDLFMLISGFLMSTNARRRESFEPMEKPRTWYIFYVRRYFRIAPVYYLSLLIVFVIFGLFIQGYANLQQANPGAWPAGGIYDPRNYHVTLSNILAHVSFAFGFIPKFGTSTGLPDWSLGLEMQFYLAFPFLYCGVRRFGAIPVIIVASAVSYAITLQLGGLFPLPSFLPLKLPLFLVGMLIAELPWIAGTLKLAATGILALVLCFAQVSDYGAQSPLLVLVGVTMFVLSAPQLSQIPLVRRVKSLFGGRLAHVLSEASYSVYLFHGVFIALTGYVLFGAHGLVLSGDGRTIVLLAIVLPGALGVSALVNRYVERPGIKLGSSVIRQMNSMASGARPSENPAR